MSELLAEFDTGHYGRIHDAQLDHYGQCVATASADGHVRIWDIIKPTAPVLLSDLGGHAAAVYQVAWAPPEVGVVLASASRDGCVIVWGRRLEPGEWHVLRRVSLQSHGAVHAIAWGPYQHGTIIASASADGTVTVIEHYEAPSGEHSWQSQSFAAHCCAPTVAVSWGTPRISCERKSKSQARLATAGGDGICVWHWDDGDSWEPQKIKAPVDLRVATRDVVWKSWDGVCEMLASALSQTVVLWLLALDGEHLEYWYPAQRVSIKYEVWRLMWMDVGNVLSVSCGDDKERVMLMKQQLGGTWDLMDLVNTEDEK